MNDATSAQAEEQAMAEAIKNEKIRRAVLAGPSCVTGEATVAEMNMDGTLTVLRPGTNDWVCVPGNENISGRSTRRQPGLAP